MRDSPKPKRDSLYDPIKAFNFVKRKKNPDNITKRLTAS